MKQEFRVGDRVKIIGNGDGRETTSHSLKIGSTGVVHKLGGWTGCKDHVIVSQGSKKQSVQVNHLEFDISLFTRIYNALVAIFCAPDVRDRYNLATSEANEVPE